MKGLIAGFQGKWGEAAALFRGIPKKILAFFVNSATLLYKVGIADPHGPASPARKTSSPA